MKLAKALEKADSEHAIRRKGWNADSPVVKPLMFNIGSKLITALGVVSEGWAPRVEDITANDWELVPISQLSGENQGQLE